MTISITAEDIAQGKPCSSSFCPIAAALNRLAPLRSGYQWCVGRTHASIVTTNGALAQSERYPLPIHVQIWRAAYDKGQTAAPIEFEFALIPGSYVPYVPLVPESPAEIAGQIIQDTMARNQPKHGDAWQTRTIEYYRSKAAIHLQQMYAEAHGAPQTGEDHLAHALTDLGIAATLRSRATGAAE